MTRIVAIPVFLLTLALATAGAVAGGGGPAKQPKPLEWEDHSLFIETNETDGDAGLQMNLDAEHWKSFELTDPKGRPLAGVDVGSRLRGVGLSELFFEAAEPPFTEFPFSRFKRKFPEGTYSFDGETTSGRRLVGTDNLSHLIPKGPNVTFPAKGARVDPNGFQVTWEPVTRPAGVKIVSYQVIVLQDERELSMYLPPSATSATIPGEFLVPGTEAEGEVLAREQSGNQTITEMPDFSTQ